MPFVKLRVEPLPKNTVQHVRQQLHTRHCCISAIRKKPTFCTSHKKSHSAELMLPRTILYDLNGVAGNAPTLNFIDASSRARPTPCTTQSPSTTPEKMVAGESEDSSTISFPTRLTRGIPPVKRQNHGRTDAPMLSTYATGTGNIWILVHMLNDYPPARRAKQKQR